MNSCLYECQILHHRFLPKAHRFAYRLFLFAIDLDELEGLSRRLRLFSLRGTNAYSFHESDYLPTEETPPHPSRPAAALKARVITHLAGRGIDLTGGRVLLVTLPRVFGYLFNPVSFYFCYDRDGRPVASIAEVTNTFREVKPYVLGPATGSGTTFSLRTPKHFYVSPFSDVDVAFDFTLRTPGGRLSVQIDDYAAGQRTLTSVLTGSRRPLSDHHLAWFTCKYPLITLRVISLIHWHAFRLWLKNVPWFPKAARPDAQLGLYRPHGSLRVVAAKTPPPSSLPLRHKA